MQKLFFVLLFLAYASPQLFAASVSGEKAAKGAPEQSHISADLKDKLKKTKDKDEKIPVIIVFKTEPVKPHEFRQQGSRRDIQNQMKKGAEESQAGVLKYLGEKEKMGRVENIQAFWLSNSIAVKAAPDVILELGKRQDLKEVVLDRAVTLRKNKKSP